MMTAVVMIVTTFFITIACFTLFPRKIERYENGHLNSDLFQKAYRLNGIEKCAALQFPSMTASNLIETGRLRQWKPTSTHPLVKDVSADRHHAYCYYYADDDKQIMQGTDEQNSAVLASVHDPMLVGACSTDPATGSLWSKFTSVIKDAFVDKEIDANHKIPYKKCVLKVALSNEHEKEQLWKYVEEESMICKGALDAVQKEYNTYVAELRTLNAENTRFKVDYGSRDELAFKLRTCTAQSNELAENIIPNMARITNELQARILAERTNLDTALQQINTQQSQLDQAWEKVISDIVLNTRTSETLQQSIVRLTQETTKANATRTACRQQHQVLVDEITKRKARVNELNSKYNILESQFNACAKDLEKTKAEIISMTTEQDALKEKNKNLKIEMEGCIKEKDIVTMEEDAWRKKANQLREQYETCSKQRALQQAIYDGYAAQAEALTQEIDDIKKRCRTHENEFHKANLETSRKQAVATIKTTHTYCANVTAMKAKKAALMDELCELNAQVKALAAAPQPCGDAVRKAKCCPYKVQAGAVVAVSYNCCGGFNYEGPNILRLRTSEATVNRVRDHFEKGAYVGLEGIPNKLYRLVDTKIDRANKNAAIAGSALAAVFSFGLGAAAVAAAASTAKDGADWLKFTTVHPSLGTLAEFQALKRNLVVVTNPPADPFVPPAAGVPDPPIGQGDQFC